MLEMEVERFVLRKRVLEYTSDTGMRVHDLG